MLLSMICLFYTILSCVVICMAAITWTLLCFRFGEKCTQLIRYSTHYTPSVFSATVKKWTFKKLCIKREQAAPARAAADLKPFISGYGRLGSQDGPFPGYQAGKPSSSRGPCRSVLVKLSKKIFFFRGWNIKIISNTKNAFDIVAVPPDWKNFLCAAWELCLMYVL
jgi:hypothetical protein